MYRGSCLCGKVKVRVAGGIDKIIHCHCSLCRKNSGTAFATNGFVKKAEFEITSGRAELTIFEFKPGRQRHFCKHCGSPVFSSNDDNPEFIRVRLGLLDSPIIERPMSHNFVESKASWHDLDANLPRYAEFEPGR